MNPLSQEQRYTIEKLRNENYSQTAISKIICKHKSLVNKELKINSDKCSKEYEADLVERKRKQRYAEKLK